MHEWRVRVVPIDEAEIGTRLWEPFAIVVDSVRGPCVVVKKLVEVEPDKSSVFPVNRPQWEPPDLED